MTRDTPRPQVSAARRWIDDRYAGRVCLAELAEAVGASPSHLRQAFAAEVGISPAAYLARVRVDRAAAMLAGGRPVKEVAAAVGFCDASHLTRRFKRLRGVTPARFAAAARGDVGPDGGWRAIPARR